MTVSDEQRQIIADYSSRWQTFADVCLPRINALAARRGAEKATKMVVAVGRERVLRSVLNDTLPSTWFGDESLDTWASVVARLNNRTHPDCRRMRLVMAILVALELPIHEFLTSRWLHRSSQCRYRRSERAEQLDHKRHKVPLDPPDADDSEYAPREGVSNKERPVKCF